MKTKFTLFIILTVMIRFNVNAQTNVSGLISSNTIWSTEYSPYIVVGNLYINTGVKLTIEAGVKVMFDQSLNMSINGELVCIGTDEDKIIFTSNQSNQSSGDWDKIHFLDQSIDAIYSGNNYISGSILKHCIIEFGGGDQNGVVYTEKAFPFIDHCMIRNNSSSGVYCKFREEILKIYNCTFMNNTSSNSGSGIYAYNIHIDVKNCMFLNHSNTAVYFTAGGAGADYKIRNCIFYNNQSGAIVNNGCSRILISNSLIYKNEDDYCSAIFSVYDGYGNNSYETIKYNTIVRNTAQNTLYIHNNHIIHNVINNNFINNENDILLNNGNEIGSTDINAVNNFWGTIQDSEIQSLIYDWYDNSNLSFINYLPFSTQPNISAPIAPPENVYKTVMGNDVEVTWNSNLESDLEGYIIYYNPIDELSYADAVIIGNDTSYTLTEIDLSDTIVVTAYDNLADGTNDLFEGHESWYSEPANMTVNTHDVLLFEAVEMYPNPADDQIFIKCNATLNYTVEIFSLDGKLQIDIQNLNDRKEINISSLEAGMYLIKLSNDEKSIITKLIKR